MVKSDYVIINLKKYILKMITTRLTLKSPSVQKHEVWVSYGNLVEVEETSLNRSFWTRIQYLFCCFRRIWRCSWALGARLQPLLLSHQSPLSCVSFESIVSGTFLLLCLRVRKTVGCLIRKISENRLPTNGQRQFFCSSKFRDLVHWKKCQGHHD